MYVPLLDRLLYRKPFEGASAVRYRDHERPAFGDLDERLLARMALGERGRLLDLGCGPGTFSAVAAARHPGWQIVSVEPSRELARTNTVRAIGEQLPLADRCIDVAICLSALRHVRDRAMTLRELRRVVVDRCWIVELDPVADARRVATHAARIGSPLLRRAFGPLVVRTAPPASVFAKLATAAGFRVRTLTPDDVQPVYVMELA